MLKKISFNYRGRKFSVMAKECKGLNKILGLIFKSKDTDALFFNFYQPTNVRIHSFFVFFPFFAIWLDGKNKVVDIRKIKPFTFAISSKKPFTKILEIPINNKYNNIISFLISRR